MSVSSHIQQKCAFRAMQPRRLLRLHFAGPTFGCMCSLESERGF